ncbi:MAG: hypothetical protein JRH06_05760 [Deltaproteobacteria bacterium]|nr:hypothetical protein [Deltaproteobacteria bacterium]MBW2137042.1 hypothetical protein [Deltaproteobacteria bacterium]
MPYYIVCNKKRNNPRIDVRICKNKCPDKQDCKAFRIFCEMLISDKNAALAEELPSAAVGAS